MDKIIVLNSSSDRTYKKKIKECMKGDEYQLSPPILNENSFLVVKIGLEDEWQSFLHCFVKDDILTFASGFTNSKFRRRGLSTELRLWVINNIKNITKIESLTMPGSHSASLLEKLDFHKEDNKMVKYIK